MTRRSRIWLVAAVVFVFVNVGGGVFAAAQGEPLHAATHGALLLGAYLVWRRRIWGRESSTPDTSRELTDSLTQIQQSVNAVAIEVERIGEGQRFITRLFTESGTPLAPGESAAESIEIKARDAAQRNRQQFER